MIEHNFEFTVKGLGSTRRNVEIFYYIHGTDPDHDRYRISAILPFIRGGVDGSGSPRWGDDDRFNVVLELRWEWDYDFDENVLNTKYLVGADKPLSEEQEAELIEQFTPIHKQLSSDKHTMGKARDVGVQLRIAREQAAINRLQEDLDERKRKFAKFKAAQRS